MVDGVTYLPLRGAAPPVDRPHESRPGAERLSAPMRLQSFVVDEANHLAIGAAYAVLGEAECPPPLVVLHGPSGIGKTHLAHALAQSSQASRLQARVVAVTGADFARHWGRSAEDDELDHEYDDENTAGRSPKPRRVAWNRVQLLVLDNIDELAGKPAAQCLLCDALDAIELAGGRAIVTARRNPTRDRRLSRRLASRLAAGLSVPLAKLGKSGRVAVLAELAHARGLSLSRAALELLAGNSPASVPELAGLLVRLDMTARLEGRKLDEALIRQHVAAGGTAGLSVRTIALRTAEHLDIKVSDLRGPSRRKEIVAARSVAMYLSRRLTDESLEAIGRHFSGRDHATVSHSVEKVTGQLAAGDIDICQAVAAIRQRLAEEC